MKILMITGDKNIFKEGTGAYERFLLQKSQVEELKAIYWGREAVSLPSAKGYDWVTSQDPVWRGLVARVIAKRANSKLQIQIHTDLFSPEVIWWARYIALRFVLPYADSIRVVSDKAKQELVKRGIKAPIYVLPIFIDLERVRNAPAVEKNNIPQESKKYILVSARLEPEKEVGMSLQIFKKVLESVPDAGLVIVGSGSLMRKLSRLVHSYGLEDKVTFLGYLVNPFSVYKVMDCMLVTSRFESFGASIVEALAVGVPVVAPDVGIARDAGAIVVPREKLADAVIEILQNPRQGVLKLKLPTKDQWAKQWRESLV